MEKYINDASVVHNEIYEAFKDLVKCPICHGILINPMKCMWCQNDYCKKCIDERSKKDERCPNKCKNQNYQKSLDKNNILSKLKFNCQICGEKIAYDNIKNHMEICDKVYIEMVKKDEDSENNNNINEKKIKKIKKEDVPKLTKGEQIPHITCKKNIHLHFLF